MLAVLLAVLIGGGATKALFFGGSGTSQSSGDIALQRGLVGWWKFNGNAKDSTPYGNDGTVSGATLAADRKGKSNSAYSFDGVSDFTTFSDAPQLDSDSVTISFWLTLNQNIDCDGNNNWRSLIKKGATASSTTGWDVVLEQSMGLQFDIGYGGVTHRSGTIPVGMTVGAPIHLTLTYDSATGVRNIYADSVLKDTGTLAAAPIASNTNAFELSRGTNAVACPNGGGYVPGDYDDVRVYNRALNADEVSTLYNEYDPSLQAGNLEAGLVGHWKLDGDGKDSTPYADDGTIHGAPPAAADERGTAGGATSFNGSSQYYSMANTPALQVTGSQTISMWLYPNSFSARRNPYGKAYGGEGTITQETAGTLNYFYGTAGGNTNPYTSCNSTTALSLNTWALVTLVRDLSAMTLTWYINGQQVHQCAAAYAAATVSTNPVTIGHDYAGYYSGSIDDVREYNRALSTDEISGLYTSYNSQISLYGAGASAGASAGQSLVGYWAFNGSALDSTPYGNNGTLSGTGGGPVLAADREGRASSAYSFTDSNNDKINIGSPAILNGANGLTYSIWLYRTAVSTGSQWPYIMGSNNPHVYYGIRSQNYGDAISFEYGLSPYDGAAGHYTNMGFCGGVGNLSLNQWHMFTITYNGINLITYRDGGFCQQNSGVTLNPSFGGTYIMADGNFNGSADDARVWNRPLSQAEVTALYNSYN